MKTLDRAYTRQQARAFSKDVRAAWGSGWKKLSPDQQRAELALAFFRIVVGWDPEQHEAAALAKAFAAEMEAN